MALPILCNQGNCIPELKNLKSSQIFNFKWILLNLIRQRRKRKSKRRRRRLRKLPNRRQPRRRINLISRRDKNLRSLQGLRQNTKLNCQNKSDLQPSRKDWKERSNSGQRRSWQSNNFVRSKRLKRSSGKFSKSRRSQSVSRPSQKNKLDMKAMKMTWQRRKIRKK